MRRCYCWVYFYLMVKSSKSFVKIGSRWQIALSILFYRNFQLPHLPLPPSIKSQDYKLNLKFWLKWKLKDEEKLLQEFCTVFTPVLATGNKVEKELTGYGKNIFINNLLRSNQILIKCWWVVKRSIKFWSMFTYTTFFIFNCWVTY